MSSITVTNANVAGHAQAVDVAVTNGVVTAVSAAGVHPPAGDVLDAGGCVVLPGLVDAHCHLDKTLWSGPWTGERGGRTLAERVATERRRADFDLPNVGYATALVEHMVTLGTTQLRTHVDVDPRVGLRGLDVVAEALREAPVDVDVVAFPQSGVLKAPGTDELLRQAAARPDVTAIGGIDPAGFDGDPVAHLRTVFAIAADGGCGLDLHIHDGGTLGAWQIEQVARLAGQHALQGRVTVSHAFALSQVDVEHQARLADLLAEHGISVASAVPLNRPLPPFDLLSRAGVTVALGSDNIQDLWSPYGNGDMLERVAVTANRREYRRDADIETVLELATTGGAAILGAHPTGHGPVEGAVADLVAVPARSVAEAIVTHPPRRWVLKAGAVVARDGRLTAGRAASPGC